MYIIIISPGCKVHNNNNLLNRFHHDLESAEPLRDFLCITFVVCTCGRCVHVDLFSLLLCAFLHADTCAVHVCFVDESLLFLQHLELHNFLYQTIQPDLVVLDGHVIDWQTWLVTISCTIEK